MGRVFAFVQHTETKYHFATTHFCHCWSRNAVNYGLRTTAAATTTTATTAITPATASSLTNYQSALNWLQWCESKPRIEFGNICVLINHYDRIIYRYTHTHTPPMPPLCRKKNNRDMKEEKNAKYTIPNIQIFHFWMHRVFGCCRMTSL